MARPELVMVRYGRCPSCGVTAFLWARSPRAKLKRCRVCLTHEKGAPHGDMGDDGGGQSVARQTPAS